MSRGLLFGYSVDIWLCKIFIHFIYAYIYTYTYTNGIYAGKATVIIYYHTTCNFFDYLFFVNDKKIFQFSICNTLMQVWLTYKIF